MFDSLSEKLQSVLKNLRGYGKLTEKNVGDALREVRVPVVAVRNEKDVLKICRQAQTAAQAQGRDVLIFDTAGRLHIDEELVQELVRMREVLKPQEILLVADAATGQEALNIAEHFDKALSVTGIVLTKLDGDARGGGALSLRAVTGKPM